MLLSKHRHLPTSERCCSNVVVYEVINWNLERILQCIYSFLMLFMDMGIFSYLCAQHALYQKFCLKLCTFFYLSWKILIKNVDDGQLSLNNYFQQILRTRCVLILVQKFDCIKRFVPFCLCTVFFYNYSMMVSWKKW